MLAHRATPAHDSRVLPRLPLRDPDFLPIPRFRPSVVEGTVAPMDYGSRSPAEHRLAVAQAGHLDHHEGPTASRLRKEFNAGLMPAHLRRTAEDFDVLYQVAHTPPASPTIMECRTVGSLTGPERQARASQVLRLVAYRCGHLYPDLVRAVIQDDAMSVIGTALGGNTKDSAKLGRMRVTDALNFAHVAMKDMARWEASQQDNLRAEERMQPIRCRAIGQHLDLPAWVHEAANDDVRQFKVAA